MFTISHVKNRELVKQMLEYENYIFFTPLVQNMFTDPKYSGVIPYKKLHQMVLEHFDFYPSLMNVQNYEKIFRHYYKSPINHDKEIINSVVYMRENLRIHYINPIIEVNNIAPNVPIYDLCGVLINLYQIINPKAQYCFVAAFSLS
jgi:hypothetical protein